MLPAQHGAERWLSLLASLVFDAPLQGLQLSELCRTLWDLLHELLGWWLKSWAVLFLALDGDDPDHKPPDRVDYA